MHPVAGKCKTHGGGTWSLGQDERVEEVVLACPGNEQTLIEGFEMDEAEVRKRRALSAVA